MNRRLLSILAAAVLSLGLAAPPALAQPADAGSLLFLEVYRVLRTESLAQPSPETLLRGADAGLRALLRDAGHSPTAVGALHLTGDERTDLEHALHRIEQVQWVVPARPMAVVYAAVSGMVAALGDPNSAFYAPDAFAQYLRRTRGDEFVGVGVVIEDRSGETVITQVLEGTPASEAGLRGGDVIMAVDGVSTAGLSLEQVSQMIRGTEGTDVVLTIRRPGQTEPLVLTITRRRIAQRVVSTRVLPSGVGYLRVTQFTQNSDEMVAAGLRSLQEQGARGIILDLRGNPGGLLEAAINIASHFVDHGAVATLESGRASPVTYMVRPRSPRHTGPTVVLVDRGSASASEVVAGALQDAGIKLVGTRTFGKATVQAIYRFRDGSGMRVTTSRYLTPAGRDIEGQGLQPDVEVSTGGVPIGSPDDAPLNRAVAMVQQGAMVPARTAP